MEQTKAFAPGNISCVFKIIPHEDPSKMHSLGMGFTVKEGVVVTVSPENQTTVLFNDSEIDFPTVESVVHKFTAQPMRVAIESPLPLGCGFGLSGASALATAYALNTMLDLGRPEEELGMIAHVAEVENLTGLGDVCAQYHGGCLAKLKEGDPLAAERLPVQERPIYYRYFGPIHTKSVIGNATQRARINASADNALKSIAALMKSSVNDFNAYIEVSKLFSIESGLLTDQRVQEVIGQVEADNGVASMIMLGHAVFSTRSFENAQQTMLSKRRVEVL